MPSPLAQAGATVEPSEYASLAQDEQFTGMWTQRSPLRDADVPYLYRKFYSASRFDSMIDGINREISARLTDVRRPGSSTYNSQTFPAGYSFYAFKYIQAQQEVIRLIYDGKDGTVYDATANQKTALYTKSSPTAHARFLAVGTTLYCTDGTTTKKIVRSPLAWAANTSFALDQYIVDSNLNLQLAIGSQTATIASITVVNNVVTVFLQSSGSGVEIPVGTKLTFAGLTTLPALNGTTQTIPTVTSSFQFSFPFVTGSFSPTPETGTVTTGTGITGGSQPSPWGTTLGAITVDGGQQWECRGSSIQNWGGLGPTIAPTVTQVTAATLYPNWVASTWYAPSGGFVIFDGANLQQLTTAGITGGSVPSPWGTTLGALTTDGSAIWTCKGPGTWVASATHAVGDLIVVNYTYYTTTTYFDHTLKQWVTSTTATNVTSAFICTVAGISGPGPVTSIPWTNGLGTTVIDGSVTWANNGNPPAWPGATQKLSLATSVIDTLGNVEVPQNLGESQSGAVTWQSAKGATTIDNPGATQISWLNGGSYSAANTGPWYWAYSGLNSITGEISPPSPTSQPLIVTAGMSAVVQGQGMADPQWDSIILWRTAQNGSTLLYDDQFPNPGAGNTWIFTDTTPDNLLNTAMAAPGSADASAITTPPPATGTAPEYHCGRIFLIDGSFVRWSGNGDTVVGNGNSAFPGLNFFQLPEQPIRLKSVTMSGGGLLVFCVSNTYVILGEGITATAVSAGNPFLPPKMFMEGVGLLSYDCVTMRGSTLYGFSNKQKGFSFDPSNGELEIGFPIGDQFLRVTTGGITAALYNPTSAYVTWHEQNSTDTGLYIADGAVGWFRWSPIAPPESGSLWSPRAAIVGGTSCVQSVETSPGTFNLLIAPAASGPILKRDNSVFTDNAAAYPSWDVKGSIALCDTGEVAEIAHIATKSIAVGARPTISLLLDEIQAGVTIEGRTTAWDLLSLDEGRHEDPPNLEPSITTYSDRYLASSTAICPKVEHFQMRIDYGTQAVADELLKFAIFGATFKERRQQ